MCVNRFIALTSQIALKGSKSASSHRLEAYGTFYGTPGCENLRPRKMLACSRLKAKDTHLNIGPRQRLHAVIPKIRSEMPCSETEDVFPVCIPATSQRSILRDRDIVVQLDHARLPHDSDAVRIEYGGNISTSPPGVCLGRCHGGLNDHRSERGPPDPVPGTLWMPVAKPKAAINVVQGFAVAFM